MSPEAAEQIAHLLDTQKTTVLFTAARVLEHDRHLTRLDASDKVIRAAEVRKVVPVRDSPRHR